MCIIACDGKLNSKDDVLDISDQTVYFCLLRK